MKPRYLSLLFILSLLLVFVQNVKAYDLTPQKEPFHSVYLPLMTPLQKGNLN